MAVLKKCPYIKTTIMSIDEEGRSVADEMFKDCIREKCISFKKLGKECSCATTNARWMEEN